jgi:hypothetical protein
VQEVPFEEVLVLLLSVVIIQVLDVVFTADEEFYLQVLTPQHGLGGG